MSIMQISAPMSARPTVAAPRRAGPVLRAFNALIEAMAATNRRRAEREIARFDRIHGSRTDARA